MITQKCVRARALWLALMLNAALVSSSVMARADEPPRSRGRAGGRAEASAPSLSEQLDEHRKAYAATKDVTRACEAGRIAYQKDTLREAGEFLSICAREGVKAGVNRKLLGEALADLAIARVRGALIEVRVNRPGAEIFVDGDVVGTSPLEGEILLDPGPHLIVAKLGQARVEGEQTLPRGEKRIVDLVFAESVPAPAPPRVAPPAAARAKGASPMVAHVKEVTRVAPVPAAAASHRVWPRAFLWTSAGVAVVGGSIAGVVQAAQKNKETETDIYSGDASRYGCASGGNAGCSSASEAHGSVGGAADVVVWTVAVSGFTALGLATVGFLGIISDAVSVQVAPTRSGMVLRGTF